jgi:hypothetical protein
MTIKTDFELIVAGHDEQESGDGSVENLELFVKLDLLDDDSSVSSYSDDDDSSIESLQSYFIDDIDFPLRDAPRNGRPSRSRLDEMKQALEPNTRMLSRSNIKQDSSAQRSSKDFDVGFFDEDSVCLMRRRGNIPLRVRRSQERVDDDGKEDNLLFLNIEISLPLKD